MRAAGAVDVLIVSLGSTAGLRAADERAAASRCERAGASVALARAPPPAPAAHADADRPRLGARGARGGRARRARAARAAGAVDLLEHDRRAAVAAPRRDPLRRARGRATGPGATGSGSARSSAGGCAQAPLLLPWSEGGAARGAGGARARRARAGAAGRRSSRPGQPTRAARHRGDHLRRQPAKKGLDRVLAAWRRVRGERRRAARSCVVAGASRARARARRARSARPSRACACVGALARERLPRAAAPRARVRVRAAPRGLRHRPARGARRRLPCSSRTPAPGPYAALPIARELDPRLVGEDSRARCAPRSTTRCPTTRARARAALAPFARAARRPARRRAATAAPACASCAAARASGRVLATSAARQPRAPRGGDAPAHVRERARAVGVGVDHDARRPRARRRARATSERSRRSGLALISSIVPRARGRREDRVEVDRVGRAALDQPAGGMADRVDQRVLDRGDHRARSSPARSSRTTVCTLAITQSSSREQLVVVVERAVGQDVDLAAREQLDALDRARWPRARARSGGAAARARRRCRSRAWPSGR